MLENLNPNLKKESIFELQVLSHVEENKIRKVFNALLYKIMVDHTAGKKTYIPNVGFFSFKWIKDKVVKKNDKMIKKAVVEIDYEVDDYLSLIIGQIQDDEKTDIEKTIKNQIRKSLEIKLD